MIRGHGEDQGIFGEGLGGVKDQQRRTSQEGGPNQLTSGLFLAPGAVCAKMAVQVTYGLGFG
jgi:hypothetical protein